MTTKHMRSLAIKGKQAETLIGMVRYMYILPIGATSHPGVREMSSIAISPWKPLPIWP